MARSKSSASGVRVAGDPDAGRLDLLINEKPVGIMTQLGDGWRVAWGKGDALEYDADSQEAAVAYVRANVAKIKVGKPAEGCRERGYEAHEQPAEVAGLIEDAATFQETVTAEELDQVERDLMAERAEVDDRQRTEYVTTAPDTYDGFGTRTVEMLPDIGHAYRVVAILDEHNDWQVSRYRSGLYYCVPRAQHDAEEASAARMLANLRAEDAPPAERDAEPQPATADAPISPQDGESGAAPSDQAGAPDAAPQPVDAGVAPATGAETEPTPLGEALAALGVDPNAPQPEPAPAKAKGKGKADAAPKPAPVAVEPVLDADGQPYPLVVGAPAEVVGRKGAGLTGRVVKLMTKEGTDWARVQVDGTGELLWKRPHDLRITGPAVELPKAPKAERAPKAPTPLTLDQVLAFIGQVDGEVLAVITEAVATRRPQVD